jgi:hypothetical protein
MLSLIAINVASPEGARQSLTSYPDPGRGRSPHRRAPLLACHCPKGLLMLSLIAINVASPEGARQSLTSYRTLMPPSPRIANNH